jgi:hypothetical protein
MAWRWQVEIILTMQNRSEIKEMEIYLEFKKIQKLVISF